MRISRAFWSAAMVLILATFIAACGSEDDESVVQGVGGNDESNAGVVVSDVETVTLADTQVDLGGHQLLITRGWTIELLDLESPPVVIDDQAYPPSVAMLPNQLVYSAGSGRFQYYAANLDSLEVQSLMRVSGQYAFVIGLSPNGEWVTVSNPPGDIFLVRVDGTSERVRLGAFNSLAALWLEDNTILQVIFDVLPGTFGGPNTNTPIAAASIYDPETQVVIELDDAVVDLLSNIGVANLTNPFATATVMNDVNTILGDVLPAALSGAVAYPEEGILSITAPIPDTPGTPVFCGTWRLERIFEDGTSEALLILEDTLFINNPMELEDGTIFFEQWYLEDCDISRRVAALVKLSPDGTLQTITNTVDPGDSQNYGFFFGDTGPRTNLSPDERYIAWIGGGLDAGYSTLNLYDVEQNVTIELERVVRDASNTSTFHLDFAFTSVRWLAGS